MKKHYRVTWSNGLQVGYIAKTDYDLHQRLARETVNRPVSVHEIEKVDKSEYKEQFIEAS